jgi:hypothetical protein
VLENILINLTLVFIIIEVTISAVSCLIYYTEPLVIVRPAVSQLFNHALGSGSGSRDNNH